MKTADKIILEKSGENIIRLYKEGLFYIAYNHSAIRFKRLINDKVTILKILLKRGNWYFRIGIVENSPILKDFKIKDSNGEYKSYIEIECDKIDTNLEEITDYRNIQRYANGSYRKQTEQEIIKAIKSLNLGLMTPVNALSLIGEWQERLKRYEEI